MNTQQLIENNLFEQLQTESALVRRTIKSAITKRDKLNVYVALSSTEQLKFRQGHLMNIDDFTIALDQVKARLRQRMI